MDPLDGIAAFARVVDCGSFSAAADRLKLSKSAISAHVQRLEERLGTRLLNRSTRSLSLTEAGAAYYRHCVRILAEADAGRAGRGRAAARAARNACASRRRTPSAGCMSRRQFRISSSAIRIFRSTSR